MKRTTRLRGSIGRRQTLRRRSTWRSATVCGGVLFALLAGIYLFSSITQTGAAGSSVPQDVRQDDHTNAEGSFTISGQVMRDGVPVSGVTIDLSGSANATITTGAVGNYQFSGLVAGGNYKVSASLARHYFTPPNRSFNGLSGNQSSVNFDVLGVCRSGKCVRNGKLAFSSGPGGWTRNIFTMDMDGGNKTNITNAASGYNSEPRWSPDGEHIVFTSDRDGNREIYRMNSDGSGAVNLSKNTAWDHQPFYSPDGRSIVFVSERDGNAEIYRMNSDGTGHVRLTDTAAEESWPSFSPDGQTILFLRNEVALRKLWTMRPDGTEQQELGADAEWYLRPSYSPDGKKIIAYRELPAGPHWSLTLNADGSNSTQFTQPARYPSYSPDGAKVVYVCCATGTGNADRVRIANLNGSSEITFDSATLSLYPDWQPIVAPRPAPFDFDGDERSDISVYRPSEGMWYLLGSKAGFSGMQWGISTDKIVPADFDGDMRTDLAVWRESDGRFYILNSFDNTIRVETFGAVGDTPVVGDWDGDGRADLTVYRSGAQSTFRYRRSMENPLGQVTTVNWGVVGDKPVLGDFDGDGKTDAAVFRPSNGIWYIHQSSNSQDVSQPFGLADDVPVPADYDGDGKTDVAVYRDGIWYILRSAQGVMALQFGLPGDVTVPADYDGDGRSDIAVFRDGIWWILQSDTGSVSGLQFGLKTDQPIQAAFAN